MLNQINLFVILCPLQTRPPRRLYDTLVILVAFNPCLYAVNLLSLIPNWLFPKQSNRLKKHEVNFQLKDELLGRAFESRFTQAILYTEGTCCDDYQTYHIYPIIGQFVLVNYLLNDLLITSSRDWFYSNIKDATTDIFVRTRLFLSSVQF